MAQAGAVGITFAIFSEENGGVPLWIETQTCDVDEQGRFTALLGSTSDDGLPLEIFSSGEARWLSMQVIPEREQSRVELASVPYALKAADAETLGGKPLSAFMLSTGESGKKGARPVLTPGSNATAGSIAKFIDATNVGDSVMTESVGRIGLNTATPQGPLHINGAVTYRNLNVGSVQTGVAPGVLFENTGSNTSAAVSENSGLVFFVTSSGSAPFSGSDQRMVIRPTGFVGLGASNPQAPLHIGGVTSYRGVNVAALQTGISPGLMLENPSTNSTVALTENNGFLVFAKSSSSAALDGGDIKFVIRPSGNVGIGTTSPGSLLTVGGLIESTTAGFKFPDGTTQMTASAGVTFARTVLVSPGASPAAGGTALLAAMAGITTNSAANPFLLKLEPGVYDIGASTLTMQPYVDIEGSGEGVTKITGSGHANIDNGTVIGASNAQLRFLTIENTGGASFAFALHVSAAGSPTLLNVTLNAMVPPVPGSASFACGLHSAAAQVTMRNVTLEGNYQYATFTAGIFATGGSVTMIDSSAKGVGANATSNRGIYLLDGTYLTMIDSTATATPGGAGGGNAIYTFGTQGPVTLHRAILNAQTGINNTNSSSIRAAATEFISLVNVNNAGGGSVVCIYSYNSNFAALNSTCG